MTGGLGSGVHTAAFNVHPRIRLAQLFQADGGIVMPMRTLMLGGEVTELKVRERASCMCRMKVGRSIFKFKRCVRIE